MLKLLLVISPVIFSAVFTLFCLSRWGIFRLDDGSFGFKNTQDWGDDSALTSEGRPKEGYPVFTVRTLAVNALGIPAVFFIGAIAAMQFVRKGTMY